MTTMLPEVKRAMVAKGKTKITAALITSFTYLHYAAQVFPEQEYNIHQLFSYQAECNEIQSWSA